MGRADSSMPGMSMGDPRSWSSRCTTGYSALLLQAEVGSLTEFRPTTTGIITPLLLPLFQVLSANCRLGLSQAYRFQLLCLSTRESGSASISESDNSITCAAPQWRHAGSDRRPPEEPGWSQRDADSARALGRCVVRAVYQII